MVVADGGCGGRRRSYGRHGRRVDGTVQILDERICHFRTRVAVIVMVLGCASAAAAISVRHVWMDQIVSGSVAASAGSDVAHGRIISTGTEHG